MGHFHFGENLYKIRRLKGISQDAMALCLDISQATYSRIEKSPTIPDTERVAELAKALSIALPELLPPVPKDSLQGNGNGLFDRIQKNFLVVVIFCALVPSAYNFVKYMCYEFNTPDYVTLLAPTSAAVAVIAYIIYWVKEIKRKP